MMRLGYKKVRVKILCFIVLYVSCFYFSISAFGWGSLSHRAMTMRVSRKLKENYAFLNEKRYEDIFIQAASEPDIFVKTDMKLHKHLHDVDMIRAFLNIAKQEKNIERKQEIIARALGMYSHIIEDRTTDNGGYHQSKVTFYKFKAGKGPNPTFLEFMPDIVEFPKNQKRLDNLKSDSVDAQLLQKAMIEYNRIKEAKGADKEKIERIPEVEEIKQASSKLGRMITLTKRLAISLKKSRPVIMQELDKHLQDRYKGVNGTGGGMEDCENNAAKEIIKICNNMGFEKQDFALIPEKKERLSVFDRIIREINKGVDVVQNVIFHKIPRKIMDIVMPAGFKVYGMAAKNESFKNNAENFMMHFAVGISKDKNNPVTRFLLELFSDNNISLNEILLKSQENVEISSRNIKVLEAKLKMEIAQKRIKKLSDEIANIKWWEFWKYLTREQKQKELEKAKKDYEAALKEYNELQGGSLISSQKSTGIGKNDLIMQYKAAAARVFSYYQKGDCKSEGFKKAYIEYLRLSRKIKSLKLKVQ